MGIFFVDVSDLQNFVTIALATAAGGEDDFTRDRLSNLRTVGSGFATLIYRLPKNTGYKELERRCKSLWEALKQNSRLPKLMVSFFNRFMVKFIRFLLETEIM